MKWYFVLFSTCIFFLSCHVQTPEEKGSELATEFIKKQLYYPESFELVECLVDTAYAPNETPETMSQLLSFSEEFSNLKLLEANVKMKEISYEHYKSTVNDYKKYGLSNSYTEYELKKAKEEFDESQEKYNAMLEKIQEYAVIFQQKQEQQPTPSGWKIGITYKAKTNGGMMIGGQSYLLVDPDFIKVLIALDEDQLKDIEIIAKELNSDL